MRSAIVVILVLALAVVAGAQKKDWVEPVPVEGRALDCSDAIPIYCGDTFTGDNTGMPNNVVNYSCVGYNENGGEVVYEFTVPAGICYDVLITMVPEGCDLDLFFLGSCDESDCLLYSGSVSTEQIATGCLEPGTYYIVVDGYGSSVPGAECPFTISVECVECDCPVPPCCPFPYACYVADFNTCMVTVDYVACEGAPVWEYDTSTIAPEIACDGVPVTTILGTILNDNYVINAGEVAVVYANFMYEPFHVSVDAHCACMELCHWYDIETSYDGGNVKVSTDGGLTWELIHPADGYPGATNAWPLCIPNEPAFTGHPPFEFRRDCFDLSMYDGQDILIGFFFGSDGSVTYPGWYIKWVKIGGPTCTPVEESSWGGIKAMFR
jgi:hypothetical protein